MMSRLNCLIEWTYCSSVFILKIHEASSGHLARGHGLKLTPSIRWLCVRCQGYYPRFLATYSLYISYLPMTPGVRPYGVTDEWWFTESSSA